MRINGRLEVPDDAIEAFCRKWGVTELAAFGSVLREDFSPTSDVDLLVTFEPGRPVTLFDLVNMQGELAQLVGRPVDLIDRAGIEESENPFRRRAILGTARVVYKVA